MGYYSTKREKIRLKRWYCVSRVIESVKLGPGSNYSLVETAFRNELLWWPAYVNNKRHRALWVQVAWNVPKRVQFDCWNLLTGVECFA